MASSNSVIDPHVHCRDEEQGGKATIASTLKLAEEQGVDMVFDMPNVMRPVTSNPRVRERLALVPRGQGDRYRLYVGLTGDESQVLEALECYKQFPEVIGFKMFAGKSVGSLSVVAEDAQRAVYRIIARRKFRGVVALHCEKEAFMNPKLWDPVNPISHTRARPEIAEVESVRDQIRFATEADYAGRLHICHVSSPESVRLVHQAKQNGTLISCEVSPHHLSWDSSRMEGPDGLVYKMNPPLRAADSVLELRLLLKSGMIDCIGTDHAPHTAEEKQPPLCLSGYPSLTLYKQFVTVFLPGLGLTPSDIKALTCDNILKIFSDKF